MSERSQTLKELRERLDRLLAEGIPDAPSKAEIARREYEEAKRANCEILEIIPGRGGKVGKRWRPFVDKPSAYVQHEPTGLDREMELRRAVGEAARRARMRSDPLNLYGGEETIADVVERQDRTR